jgi:dual specificity tyrosine-phosphorylation-regulated kinase 2/3/4
MLGIRYNPGIDMWSLGCIIAELFNKQLFFQGSTTQEYLEFLIAILGLPESEIEE